MKGKNQKDDLKPRTFKDDQGDYRHLKNMAYKLSPGQVMNPLRKLPRNLMCPCKSGKKFKKCHLDKLPITVSIRDASHISKCMGDYLFKGIPIQFVEDKQKEVVREFAIKSDANGNIEMSKAVEVTNDQP